MSDRKVLVTSNPRNRVAIGTTDRREIRVFGGGTVAGSGATQFAALTDVDVTGAETNEVPVYDGALNKYVVKVIPRIDGGSF